MPQGYVFNKSTPILYDHESLPLKKTNLAIVALGNLSFSRVLEAYEMGYRPGGSLETQDFGEFKTFIAPDQRLILSPDSFNYSRIRRRDRERFHIGVDQQFDTVLRACAHVDRKKEVKPGHRTTWIDEEYFEVYAELHEKGYAHSIETYVGDRLVGGLVGVGMGSIFHGTSMFHFESNASKYALEFIVRLYSDVEGIIDCESHTNHLEFMGAELIPADDYGLLNYQHMAGVDPFDTLL